MSIPTLPDESWASIPDTKGYWVSNLGRVYSERTSRLLKARRMPRRGHMQVGVRRQDGTRYMTYVHRLVALAFIGPQPSPAHEVCHGDGDPTNNRVENLRWGTRLDNAADMRRHGTHNNTRRTHCVNGHPFDDENTRRDAKGHRDCRACERARKPAENARRRAARAARRQERVDFEINLGEL